MAMPFTLLSDTKPSPPILRPDAGNWVLANRLYRPGRPTLGLTISNELLADSTWLLPRFSYSITSRTEPPTPDLPVEQREMPVIGFRAWHAIERFDLGVGRRVALKSTGFNNDWLRDGNRAACSQGHSAPDQRCGCGLYVLASLEELGTHVEMGKRVVVGAVMGWGRVVQHGTEGWRAQNAKILALLDCRYSPKQDRLTQAAAETYGLEVKTRPQLEALVREHGEPFA